MEGERSEGKEEVCEGKEGREGGRERGEGQREGEEETDLLVPLVYYTKCAALDNLNNPAQEHIDRGGV